jgi:hypothetical protein
MARSGFRFPSRRRRLTSVFAKKQLIWTNTLQTVVESAGANSVAPLLSMSQVIANATTGNVQHAKVVKLLLDITSASLATAESRLFFLTIDDTTPGNPLTVASYGNTQPFALGRLHSPGNAAGQPLVPLFNGHRDNLRSYKVMRKISADQSLFLSISPAAAAGNQLSFTIFARALVQLE